MIVERDDIIAELGLRMFGQQGWLTSKSMDCPYCHKKGKWAVMFVGKGGVFHCFKCGEKTSIFSFLREIGRSDLIKGTEDISIKSKLTPLIKESPVIEESGLEEIQLPIGACSVQFDSYLEKRGFLKRHYEEFEPFVTNSPLERKLNDYICFKIKQNGKFVAYLARSRKSKEWHANNLDRYKLGLEDLMLRYRNSNTDFTKLLGGGDGIKTGVETLFVVEGLFDKINIDRLLQGYDGVGCVFTFGKSLSNNQIKQIVAKSPKQVILMYDNDALREIKEYSLKLNQYVPTFCAYIKDPNVDPGSMTEEYFDSVIDNIEYCTNFYVSKLEKHL